MLDLKEQSQEYEKAVVPYSLFSESKKLEELLKSSSFRLSFKAEATQKKKKERYAKISSILKTYFSKISIAITA